MDDRQAYCSICGHNLAQSGRHRRCKPLIALRKAGEGRIFDTGTVVNVTSSPTQIIDPIPFSVSSEKKIKKIVVKVDKRSREYRKSIGR